MDPSLSARTSPPTPRPSYRRFLRGRWAARARGLGLHALAANVVLFAVDLLYVHRLPAPPSVLHVAAVRLPWILVTITGLAAIRRLRSSALLPGLVVGLSILWAWGTDWAYFALGLGGSTVQALVMVLCFIAAATFMPVRLRTRLVVFGLMAGGHLALGLAYPPTPQVSAPLLDAGVLLALAGVETVVFEAFSVNDRRRFLLHRNLLRKVTALQASRRRADRAASELGRIAERVAHEVNNPLSAVKVNVRWLADPQDPAERREVVAETLQAVDRIARSVCELEQPAVTPVPRRSA